MVIEIIDMISVNTIIESRMLYIFNENRSQPIHKIGNNTLLDKIKGKEILDNKQNDNEIVESHRSKRQRNAKNFGNDHFMHLV